MIVDINPYAERYLRLGGIFPLLLVLMVLLLTNIVVDRKRRNRTLSLILTTTLTIGQLVVLHAIKNAIDITKPYTDVYDSPYTAFKITHTYYVSTAMGHDLLVLFTLVLMGLELSQIYYSFLLKKYDASLWHDWNTYVPWEKWEPYLKEKWRSLLKGEWKRYIRLIMNKRMNVRKLALGSLFIALSLLLPAVFHMVGLGEEFLPRHIPVFLAGFFAGPTVGMLVGIVSPILTGVLTRVLPFRPPVAQMMAFELGLYGLLTGIFSEKLHLGVYISLLGAMVCGRVVYGLLGYFVLPLFGLPKIVWPLAPLLGAIRYLLPGVIIQIIVIPAVVSLFMRKRRVLFPEKKGL